MKRNKKTLVLASSLILSAVFMFGTLSTFADTTVGVEPKDNVYEADTCDDCNGDYCGGLCDDCLCENEAEDYALSENYDVYDDAIAYADISEAIEVDENEYDISDFNPDDYALVSDGIVVDDMLLAASCKHSWQETYQFLNNEKHSYTKKCTKCGKVTANGKQQNHVSDGCKSYSQKDSTYHNIVYKCKKCGQNYTKQAKHYYSNGTCKYCGYAKPTATKKPTPTKKPTTTKTSAATTTTTKTSGVLCANKDKQGKCWMLGSLFKNENDIHATCPKCGASGTNATYVSTKKRGTSVRVGSGKKFSVYHQYVKCNNCGKKYYNYCYDQDN